ncbi:PAS domain-containing protein [Lacticaseibacillus yichunensis]|uniref:PAS domain-containing protein n=1 Tax=Lacticaseibacillus yichunensis TaxID=2486015 RepID=A0ABW4CMI5_9LACO
MAQQLADSQQLGSARQNQTSERDVINAIHQDTPMPVAPPEVMAKLQAAKAADAGAMTTRAPLAAGDSNAPRINVARPAQQPAALASDATSGTEEGRIAIDGINPAKILLPTGSFDLDQLTNVLRLLPLDLTFVDNTDTVRWFSDSGSRVFPRTTAVIGRLVQNCHPPKSVDKVEKILADFHSGKETHADFWIDMHGKMVYIRYFAITDPSGHYLGCLEVTQDITGIRALEGEKRL